MGGKRVYGYREGDRSEYLAQFLLSRFSFVYPFPRQEDFGVADFLCILGRIEKTVVFPEDGFYVQVKSNEDDITYDKDAASWISNHMDLPLLICVIDKKDSHLKMYSTSKSWVGLFKLHSPDTLVLRLNEGTNNGIAHVDREKREIIVPIGDPILSWNSDEIESKPDICAEILRPWLNLDKLNIARRSIGRIYCSGFVNWKPNEVPTEGFNQYTFGPGYPKAEKDLAQILTALAHNYRHFKNKKSLEAVVSLMCNFPEHLDGHGEKFVSGELGIEDETA